MTQRMQAAPRSPGTVIDDNMVLLVTGPHHYPWSHPPTLLVRRLDVLLVNRRAQRYCDETLFLDYHTEAGNALSRRPDMICWAVLDSATKDEMIRRREVTSGMEREAVRYNACCAAGRDADFGKERRFLLPVPEPPFYAVLSRQGFDTILGDIKVDHRMRVIAAYADRAPRVPGR